MSRILNYMALAACLGLAGAGSALGQTTAAAGATFESLDKNSDGKVSVNEAADDDALFVAFKGLDKNKDGELTRKEFAAFQRAKG